jgi:hypothetical protein
MIFSLWFWPIVLLRKPERRTPVLPQKATDQGARKKKHKAAPIWACLGLVSCYALKIWSVLSAAMSSGQRYAKFDLGKNATRFLRSSRNLAKPFLAESGSSSVFNETRWKYSNFDMRPRNFS